MSDLFSVLGRKSRSAVGTRTGMGGVPTDKKFSDRFSVVDDICNALNNLTIPSFANMESIFR